LAADSRADPDEARARERMAEAAAAMVAGVERAVPAWVRREVARLLIAWGRLDAESSEEVLRQAEEAGEAAARRVASELAALLALDPAEQRATPLQIIRGAVAEPTAVLAAAGVPEVVRDEFDERFWPEDRYGLVPRTLRDVDPDLAAVHFAWGMGKAEVHRARHQDDDR
jgi:hypothetical protein